MIEGIGSRPTNPIDKEQSITVDFHLDRTDLYYLLKGVGTPKNGVEGLTKININKFHAGAYNVHEWDFNVLETLNEIHLWMMYQKMKKDPFKENIIIIGK
jgi:hypothetical protein